MVTQHELVSLSVSGKGECEDEQLVEVDIAPRGVTHSV